MSDDILLHVENLKVHFSTESVVARAVDGVSFSLKAGEMLGIVGESGSGKTVTGQSIMRLINSPNTTTTGRIVYKGDDIREMKAEKLRRLRGDRISMVFQDPMTTLNPVLTIGTQLTETILTHRDQVTKAQARKTAADMLGRMGIADPVKRLDSYPHQFSGGMRQRVAIATALINGPELLIADEPTTALDVTVQSQIALEIQDLCRQSGASLIWISHDLALVAALVDTICIMYAGRVVEIGPVDEVLAAPVHPYTRGLIDSVPSHNKPGQRLVQIDGAAPSPAALPKGCAFHPRCFRSDNARCQEVEPVSTEANGRVFRCHYPLGAK